MSRKIGLSQKHLSHFILRSFQFERQPTYDQKISNKYVRRKMPLLATSEAIRILADDDNAIEDSDDHEDISALV